MRSLGITKIPSRFVSTCAHERRGKHERSGASSCAQRRRTCSILRSTLSPDTIFPNTQYCEEEDRASAVSDELASGVQSV